MIASPEQVLAQALTYARHGWPVFPCRPGAKEPLTRHGFRDATTRESVIRKWWCRQPDANLGLATGLPGPDVLDVDQHGAAGNGFGACHRLEAAQLLDGAGAVVVTPGGGLHYYFTGTMQASRRLPGHHLDFRSTGGYVLAPPSQIDGRLYRPVKRGSGSTYLSWSAVTTLLEPSRRSVSPMQPTSSVQGSRLLSWVERLEPGNRNCGLFWAACRAIDAGQLTLLDELAVAAASTGLPSQEIDRTIASARQRAGRSTAA